MRLSRDWRALRRLAEAIARERIAMRALECPLGVEALRDPFLIDRIVHGRRPTALEAQLARRRAVLMFKRGAA